MKRFCTSDLSSVYARNRSQMLCSAYFIGDGFDTYATFTSEAATGLGSWTTAPRGVLSGTTRFATGNSWYFNNSNGVGMSKTGGPNENTWFCHLAFVQTNAPSAFKKADYIQFLDTGTAQCTIYFDTDGHIKVTSGDINAAVVATWTGAFVLNSYDSYQFKVIIHNTNGEIHIRKNGASTDSFAVTNINTRGGTANSYANEVVVGHGEGTTLQFLDDVLFYTGSGVSPNDWVGDIRCVVAAPNLDTAQKDFSQVTTGTSLNIGQTDTATPSVLAVAVNTVTCVPLGLDTSPGISQGGTFTSVTANIQTGFVGNVKLALYLADGNVQGFASNSRPGTLVAVSNTLTNPVNGNNTFTFPGTVSILKGYRYFWAYLSDTAFNPRTSNAVGVGQGYQYVTPYAGGFPTQLATLTTSASARIYTIFTTLTPTNAGCVDDFSMDSTTTYLTDNVVGEYDLYDLSDLNYTPTAIIGVNLRASIAKSDAGGRGFKMAGFSGATAFETAEYNPLTTFTQYSVFYNEDPDTAVAWTPGGVNALQIGPKVSS